MENKDKLELIPAANEDCELLYRWANDDEVRRNSFNTTKIAYEDHKEWFQSKISSEMTTIYILKSGNKSIGTIRLEVLAQDRYLISYSIASEFRRKGYATMMLKLVKKTNKDKVLVGRVKEDNIGSIKSFVAAGYKVEELLDGVYVFISE